MENSSFLSSIDFSQPKSARIFTPKTPQKTIRKILGEKRIELINSMPKKRSFGIEFKEFESSPSKIQKSTNSDLNPRISIFKAGENAQFSLQKGGIQKIVLEAIQPLILEIQSLKSEILSLKNERITPIPIDLIQPKTTKEIGLKQGQNSMKKAHIASQNSAENTAKKTFAEIAKLNSLVAEQSIKLDKWTVVERKGLKKDLKPKKSLNPVDRRILFLREKSLNSVNTADLLLAINLAIKKCELPEHIRLLRLWETPSGAISGLLKEGANAEMLNPAREEILIAVKKSDPSISSFQAAEQWYSLRIHTVSLQRYLNSTGMKTLKEEIESTNGLNLPIFPRWINQKRALERFNNKEILFSTTIIKVRSKIIADSLIANGIEFGGKKHSVELFNENRVDIICSKCSKFGHNSYNACQEPLKCNFCAGNHETKDHKCSLKGCTALTGKICSHTPEKCINCKGSHFSNSNFCPKRLEMLDKMRKQKKEEFLKLQESRKKIAVIIPLKSTRNSEILEEKDIEMPSPSAQLC